MNADYFCNNIKTLVYIYPDETAGAAGYIKYSNIKTILVLLINNFSVNNKNNFSVNNKPADSCSFDQTYYYNQVFVGKYVFVMHQQHRIIVESYY